MNPTYKKTVRFNDTPEVVYFERDSLSNAFLVPVNHRVHAQAAQAAAQYSRIPRRLPATTSQQAYPSTPVPILRPSVVLPPPGPILHTILQTFTWSWDLRRHGWPDRVPGYIRAAFACPVQPYTPSLTLYLRVPVSSEATQVLSFVVNRSGSNAITVGNVLDEIALALYHPIDPRYFRSDVVESSRRVQALRLFEPSPAGGNSYPHQPQQYNYNTARSIPQGRRLRHVDLYPGSPQYPQLFFCGINIERVGVADGFVVQFRYTPP